MSEKKNDPVIAKGISEKLRNNSSVDFSIKSTIYFSESSAANDLKSLLYQTTKISQQFSKNANVDAQNIVAMSDFWEAKDQEIKKVMTNG